MRRGLENSSNIVASLSDEYEKHVRSEMAARVMTALEDGERDPDRLNRTRTVRLPAVHAYRRSEASCQSRKYGSREGLPPRAG